MANKWSHSSAAPGVRACEIMFSDGLSLAGNFPSEAGRTVCARWPRRCCGKDRYARARKADWDHWAP